ncbi:hypothetical protein [Gryllotalpicola kribbensis]|uniref:hypothetical protein n=1 Tax=Gryllotalpicola kribbensis TaxID=993084 RepID=UPI0031CE8568
MRSALDASGQGVGVDAALTRVEVHDETQLVGESDGVIRVLHAVDGGAPARDSETAEQASVDNLASSQAVLGKTRVPARPSTGGRAARTRFALSGSEQREEDPSSATGKVVREGRRDAAGGGMRGRRR